MRRCSHCQKESPGYRRYGPTGRAWWNVNGYHGIWGYFCPDCFDMIEHCNGEPRDPKGYQTVLVAQQLRLANG